MIKNISPIDGRYKSKTKDLEEYFSEYALIKYRVKVEIEYFIKLLNTIENKDILSPDTLKMLRSLYKNFSDQDANRVKEIEKVTNHDVKAVEYFIKEKLAKSVLKGQVEYIHFALTSQDINNTCLPLLLKEGLKNVVIPLIKEVNNTIKDKAIQYIDVPLLARTHGQPASPTGMGKELMVYVERLEAQINNLESIDIKAKFGGATGNFNAHLIAYPDINWLVFGDEFVSELGLTRAQYTTQIAHYDSLSEVFHALSRIDTILIDFCRDIWTYVSMNYFTQKVIANEVGSSAMPHKVNPIDFENAEGNLGIANAIMNHLASKLPISRLQRDLTDSTVTRNFGTPLGHMVIALKSILKGISKLEINKVKISEDLEENWAVVAEGIQNILRREKYPKPYEALKDFSRGKDSLTKANFMEFIDSLEVSDNIKSELKAITPFNYVGYALVHCQVLNDG
ncbi:MAG: adenylosuccinate lyase [Saprospiraceae bacterium]